MQLSCWIGLRNEPRKHSSQEQTQDGDEGMHDQLLVGPVELRPEGAYPRVLEIAESALGSTLTTVGFDNLSRRPFSTRGSQP
jgi:hypothetical protein